MASTLAAPNVARRPFRQHTRPAHLNTPLLQQLCQEWSELHHSPSTAGVIQRWQTTLPGFDGLNSPGEITDHIDNSDQATEDQVMQALLDAFQDGDQLAGRILLQAMLPGLTHLTRRVRAPRGTQIDETLQRALTEFWWVITTTTARPSRGVAGRLQLDTLHRLTGHRRDSDVWEEHTSSMADVFDDDPTADDLQDVRPLAGEDSPVVGKAAYDADAGLLELLLHARDTAVITADDARFLAEVYVVSDNMAHAARRLGKQPAAVRQRCARLRHRLVEAVIDDQRFHEHELLSA